MVKNTLLLCLLSAIIILFYVGMRKQEYFENTNNKEKDITTKTSTTCEFKPQGKSKSECNDICKESNPICTPKICHKLCDECYDTNCQWVVNSLKPHQPKITAKPLVNAIEVSWQRPKTEYRIIKYTIVLQKTKDNEHKSFYFPISKGNTDIKYEIVDLDPEETYIIYAIATNRFGDSPISNKIIIQPLKKGVKKTDKGIKKPVHELAYQRGEYEAEDLQEVLQKVIESKKMSEPYRVVARY